jgi:hypothetical protein
MSIADAGIQILIWLIQGIIAILPQNLPFFTIETYSKYLNDIKNNTISTLSAVSFLLPIKLFLLLFSIIIFAEISLLLFRITKWLINLIRGAGT